jgi:hypothetical protein
MPGKGRSARPIVTNLTRLLTVRYFLSSRSGEGPARPEDRPPASSGYGTVAAFENAEVLFVTLVIVTTT